jgi:type IV pilus assembly protein PilA
MKKLSQKGFTMIELLVVLLIIGILAAVAAPLFLGNSDRAKASEAVAAVGGIRGAERMSFSQGTGYLTVDGSIYDFHSTGSKNALGVSVTKMAYFSPAAYTVVKGDASMDCDSIAGKDFLITANGYNSGCLTAGCGGTGTDDPTDGARKAGDVSSIKVEMDNTGYTCLGTGCTGAAAGTCKTWLKY